MKKLFRHYKGKVYEYIGLARHTEMDINLVLYKEADVAGATVWARPENLFYGKVMTGGEEVKRFVPVEEEPK
jgi:hypothetical protein